MDFYAEIYLEILLKHHCLLVYVGSECDSLIGKFNMIQPVINVSQLNSGFNATMASKGTFKTLFILLAGLKVLKGSKTVSRNSKLSFTDGLSIC